MLLFKLYNAYDSMDDYDRLCEENGIFWGVTKVTPKTDDCHFRSNYQFCQAIELQMKSYCVQTFNIISNILHILLVVL